MDNQNFKFAFKFPLKRGFSLSPNFAFLHDNFSTKKQFSTDQKFREGNFPSSRNDATATVDVVWWT